MSVVLLGVTLLLLLAVAGGVAFAVALARQGRRDYAAQGQVVPGQPSQAPSSWAGAHTPEARLHRRLADAVRGLRAVAGMPGETARLLDMRVELEQQALQVDRRLVAAAALPAGAREPAMDKAAQAVAAIEQAAGDLAGQIAGGTFDGEDAALTDLTQRIQLAAEVQAELEALEALGTDAAGGTWTPSPEPETREEPEEGGGTTATA